MAKFALVFYEFRMTICHTWPLRNEMWINVSEIRNNGETYWKKVGIIVEYDDLFILTNVDRFSNAPELGVY